MNNNYKSSQIQSLEKILQKVKNSNGKFISHKLVTKWLESWGSDNEIKAPSNFISKYTLSVIPAEPKREQESS